MDKRRPNIIFLMTDQQRYDTFTKVNKIIQTPCLDRLIEDSVFFKNAYCSNPSCVPSRAAIMTGKFPSECQCPTYISKLPITEKTFMTKLQEAGYYTAVVGKQHFAESEINRGYDEEYIIDGHSAMAPGPTIKLYRQYLREKNIQPSSLVDNDLISGGTWKSDSVNHIDDFIGELGKKWLGERIAKQENGDDTPWFFTLSFPGPHHPYDCEGTPYADQYALEDMHLSESTYEDLDTKGPQFKGMGDYSKIYLKDYSEETFRKTKRAYYANMSLIDEKIGQVIEMLKANDLYDNTMIIYSTDHGDFMGDYGLVEKLQCLQDSLMRVPLFVKPPVQGFQGIEVDEKVLNIDIAATCLEVAGAPIEASMSSYTYTPYWDTTKEKQVRDSIYMEAGTIKGVIQKNIKTIHYMDRDYGELYDLEADPLERRNLWEDKAYESYKLEGYRAIVNYMYRSVPKWQVKWNEGTPEI